MKVKLPEFDKLILYEDENYIVINKPPYISSLDDRIEHYNILKMARSFNPDVQLCHRLDKETSGVLVISKNNEAYKFMAMKFEKREVTKYYHAVVDGIHEFRDLEVNLPISILGNGSVYIDKHAGKPSVTFFNTMKAYKQHSLISCQPITGRLHQIRIHLSTSGAPITGDSQYGGKPFFLSSVKRKYKLAKFEDERPIMQRLALHASSIKFESITGKEIKIEAPYPKDFRVLVNQLDKNV